MNAVIEEQWILEIDGRRYNLTDWAKAHPGGVNVLRRFNNKDASKSFHAKITLLPRPKSCEPSRNTDFDKRPQWLYVERGTFLRHARLGFRFGNRLSL
jgi:hypothetical protein